MSYFPKGYIEVKCWKLETHFPTEMLLQTVMNSQVRPVKLIKFIINKDICNESSIKLYLGKRNAF